ncbi:hypothetical protein [uncultured Ramlibacter sp.]|uniref:hypothetical protein n=1 Tax=uncultured Ramlibacter sp. TaxID=260755 RepID=UPI002626498E|nr:hypothetical protein [uncultured Ramlibacter sp.]
MSMLGQAALAMWWDMAGAMRADFEHWHSHEHFPERLAIPGFRRASRWSDARGGEGVFQMYELEDHGVLSSGPYLARLNAPSPWSTRMMPHHRNMVRSQCGVLESHGGVTARHALTVRLSPAPGSDGDILRQQLAPLLAQLPGRAGLTGAHLLQHRTPAIAQTTEQKIRGGDSFADWVLVATGYDAQALQALERAEFGQAALATLGASPGSVSGLYQLSYSATPVDTASVPPFSPPASEADR